MSQRVRVENNPLPGEKANMYKPDAAAATAAAEGQAAGDGIAQVDDGLDDGFGSSGDASPDQDAPDAPAGVPQA